MKTSLQSLSFGAVLLGLLAAAPAARAQNILINFTTGSETQLNLGLDPNYLADNPGVDYDHMYNVGLSGVVNLSLGVPAIVPVETITFESDVNSYVGSTTSYVSTRDFTLTAPISTATVSLTQAFTVNIGNVVDTLSIADGAPLVFDLGSDDILTVTPLAYSTTAGPGSPSTGTLDATFEVTQIPEPSTSAAVLGLATLGFAGLRRFRRRAR